MNKIYLFSLMFFAITANAQTLAPQHQSALQSYVSQAKTIAIQGIMSSPQFQASCSKTGEDQYTCTSPKDPNKTVTLNTKVEDEPDYSDAPGSAFFSFTNADDALPVTKGSFSAYTTVQPSFVGKTRSFIGPSAAIWYAPVNGVQLRAGVNGITAESDESGTQMAAGDALFGAKVNLFQVGQVHVSGDLLANINIGHAALNDGLTSPSAISPTLVATYATSPTSSINGYVSPSIAFNHMPAPATVGVQWSHQMAAWLTVYLGLDEAIGAGEGATTPYAGATIMLDKKQHWQFTGGFADGIPMDGSGNTKIFSVGLSYSR